jgi:hypothetical protein
MLKLTYLQDPGHGWLLVDEVTLRALGMSPRDFSACSYKSRDGICALEEDCDMPKFLAHLDQRGVAYELRSIHTNSEAACRRWGDLI